MINTLKTKTMISKKALTTFATLTCLLSFTMAQKGIEDGSKFGKGQDSIRAVTNLSLYQQFVKQKAFKDALPSWRILFNEAPRASLNMYIHGVTMFKILISETKDPALRRAYVDTVLLIYDRRAQYFGKKAEVMARKAVDLRDLDPERSAESYKIISEIIKAEGNAVPEFGINLLMQLSIELFNKNQIQADEVVNNFSKSMEILDFQFKNSKDDKEKETIKGVMDNIQVLFAGSRAANCDAIIPVAEAKFNSAPEDIDNLTAVLNMMQAVKCEDSPVYAKAAEKVHELKPSSASAYNLGKYFLARKDFNKAIPYYQQAINLEDSSAIKARYLSELALIYLASGQNPAETRRIARQALELNPNDGRSLITIGRLYASYNKNISDKPFEQNSAYWAAVDKFIQAKRVDSSVAEEADQLIATYSSYFPTQEESFFNDVKEGQEYTVPGWINEVTRVRIRK